MGAGVCGEEACVRVRCAALCVVRGAGSAWRGVLWLRLRRAGSARASTSTRHASPCPYLHHGAETRVMAT
jgi:hypothetical protein